MTVAYSWSLSGWIWFDRYGGASGELLPYELQAAPQNHEFEQRRASLGRGVHCSTASRKLKAWVHFLFDFHHDALSSRASSLMNSKLSVCLILFSPWKVYIRHPPCYELSWTGAAHPNAWWKWTCGWRGTLLFLSGKRSCKTTLSSHCAPDNAWQYTCVWTRFIAVVAMSRAMWTENIGWHFTQQKELGHYPDFLLFFSDCICVLLYVGNRVKLRVISGITFCHFMSYWHRSLAYSLQLIDSSESYKIMG